MSDKPKYLPPEIAFDNALRIIEQAEIDELRLRVATQDDLVRADHFQFDLPGLSEAGRIRTMYRWLVLLEQVPQLLYTPEGDILNPENFAVFYAEDETALDPEIKFEVEAGFNSEEFQRVLLRFLAENVYAKYLNPSRIRKLLSERQAA